MPKIKGCDWYTAAGRGGFHSISGSERVELTQPWFGYRRSLQGLTQEEIESMIQTLKEGKIFETIKTSQVNHTGIPAGTPFLQISDAKSVLNLEKSLIKIGIELPADRFDIYKEQMNMYARGGRR